MAFPSANETFVVASILVFILWLLFFCWIIVATFDSYVRRLKEEVQNLEWAKRRAQHSIDYARRYGEPIEADVEQWIQDAETAANEARRTLVLDAAAIKTCFWGLLPNPFKRYRLGRDARRTLKVIMALRLIMEGRFDGVYCENCPPGLVGGATDLNSLAGHGGDTIPDSFCSKAPGDCENRDTDDAGGGIRGLRPPVLSPRPFVDDVSSTRDSFNSFGPREGPGGDKDSPVRPSNKGEWSNGDDEKVNKESTSQRRKDDSGSCLSTSVKDEESKYEVGNTLSANMFKPVHHVSPNGSSKRRITSWQKGPRLGSGSFGFVYEGFADDGFLFAIKEVSLLDQGSRGKQSLLQLEREISLLSWLEHENIVLYLGTDKDNEYLYIFLEFMAGGSLAALRRKYKFTDSQVSEYTRQILNGLKYLHDQKVVHRDIKCANILVDASGSVKLTDFGLAKAIEMSDAKSSKGTPFWMAPEVVNPKKRSYGSAADIWSLGCTVLEMLTGQRPYSHLEGAQALFQIGQGKPPPVPDDISGDARDLILKCLQVIPNNRPSAAQLLDHPFVRKPPTSASASPRFNHTGP